MHDNFYKLKVLKYKCYCVINFDIFDFKKVFNVPLAFNYRVPRCLQGHFYKGSLVAPDVLKSQTGSNFATPQCNFYLESDRKMTARILQLAALMGLMLHATSASSINGTTLNITKTPAVIVEPNPGNIFI